MIGSAVIMLFIVGGIVWGGFAAALWIAMRLERKKQTR